MFKQKKYQTYIRARGIGGGWRIFLVVEAENRIDACKDVAGNSNGFWQNSGPYKDPNAGTEKVPCITASSELYAEPIS